MFGKWCFFILSLLTGLELLAQHSNGILVKFKTPRDANLPELQANALAVSPAIKSVEKLLPATVLKNSLRRGEAASGEWYWVKLDSESALPGTIQKLNQLATVEIAEPNYRYQISGTPDDPFFAQQWALQKNGIAWDQISTPKISSGDKIIVGLLDTGVDLNHPDLAPNLWKNPKEIPDNGIDDDQNGYVDDYFGWDFSEADNCPLPEKMEVETGDYGWHGTHCAGILGAVTNNHEGISGVTPCVQVMPLKIFPQAWFSTIIQAIYYAVENDAQILTNSWGGSFGSQAVHAALRFATQQGVLCFFAAGNQAQDTYFFPAFYPEVVAVGACDRNGRRAWFSNFGDWVDFAAPGVDILSTGPTNYGNYPMYFFHNGTSMATPFVAGLAALIKVQQPRWTNEMILQQMRHTADFLPEANLGAGRINAHLALACAPETTLTVFPENLPSGTRFQMYQSELKAFAGIPPYQWVLENPPNLPAGLHFCKSGKISGIPQTACTAQLQFSVEDQTEKRVCFQRQLQIYARDFLSDVTNTRTSLPLGAKLARNYPNPFSPAHQATSLTFCIPVDGFIRLEIFNVLGEHVRKLAAGDFPAGQHILEWDGKNDRGKTMSQGRYFCRLSGEDYQICQVIVIVE